MKKVHWHAFRAKALKLFVDQFLLISYIVAAVIALTWPAPGKAVSGVQFTVSGHRYAIIKTINIMIVFFISGLMLRTDDIKAAWRHKLGVLFGFVSTLAVTPCLGFAFREISLTPEAYTMGLTLTTAVPQTLGIGISLVRSMGGNEGLALLLTTGTNIVGIFTMPPWLQALFSGTGFSLSIDMVALLVNLLISVLVPSMLGKLLRDVSAPVRRFVTKHKVPLGLFSTANLAFIVWQVLSSAQATLVEQPFVGVVYVILLSAAQHVIYLAFNFAVTTWLLRLPAPENVATGVMASQKSGPVSVAVISYITDDVSLQGLMAIPAVIGQLVQVFIGSALVPFLAKYTARYRAAQKAADEAAAGDAAAAALEGGVGDAGGSSDGEGKPGSKASEQPSAEQSDAAEAEEDEREAAEVYRQMRNAATVARIAV